jgi:acetylglutamate kinase
MINIIKVGGAVVEDAASLSALLDEFVKLEGPKVLVHGGGRTATQVASQLGIESKMVGGRRITDEQMLRVVTMVYAGLVNKNIVAQLQARGVNALGLTGADLNLIRAHRRPITPEGVDFGFVGDVDSADGSRLLHLLASGITPIVAPLTHDGQGHLLNTNADTMAQTVATALSTAGDWSASGSSANVQETGGFSADAIALTFCFELPGVLRNASDPTSLITRITEPEFRTLVAEGVVSGGMIPKLENAFATLRAGVSCVRITNIYDLQGGTLIC